MKQLYIALFALSLVGCSLFGGDDVDLSKPAELLEFESSLDIKRNWTLDVGEGSGEIYSESLPVLLEDTIYVADRSGKVHALDKASGQIIWVSEIDRKITGAVGVGGDLVLVGTQVGQVHAFNRESGEHLWETQLSSQVLAAPATDGNVAVAVTQDGKIYGLDGVDGTQVWLADVSLPLLTVHGNAKPTIVDDSVYIGLDNGKAAAFRVSDGVRLWEVRVGVPEGKNDLERMVDVDGQLLYHSGNIYAASYQTGVMAINPEAGRGLWFQEGSIKNSPGAWGGTLVVTQEDGIVKAFNASDGTLLWETEEFKNRVPNSPALTNSFVAFSDFEGYIHFLTRRTGELIGRQKVGGDGIRSPTIVDGDNVIVLTNDGTLSSYKVSEL